jgi:hypothetical protein
MEYFLALPGIQPRFLSLSVGNLVIIMTDAIITVPI